MEMNPVPSYVAQQNMLHDDHCHIVLLGVGDEEYVLWILEELAQSTKPQHQL